MWDDIETLERVSRFAPYIFIFLGFVVALVGQLVRSALDSRISKIKAEADTRSRSEKHERCSKFIPYLFIFLGFAVALAGQFIRSTVDARVLVLKAEADAARKRTPPDVDAYLATLERTGELLVVIDAKNLIPFRAHWSIVTEKNRIVAGIMLDDYEIHPAEDRKRFTAKANINGDQVINEYIEFSFQYESLYSAELGSPPELHREVVKRYRFKDGHVFSR